MGYTINGASSGASLSDATPQPTGTAAAGVSTSAARADHVHAASVAAADITDAGAVGVDLVQSETAAEARAAARSDLTPSTTGALVILDPSVAASMTLVSGRISAMVSQVGSLTFAPATSGQRPLLVANGINGLPIVHQSASRLDELALTDAALQVADPLLVAVCRVTTYGGANSIWIVEDSAPTYARWSLWCASVTTSDLRIDTNIAVTAIQRSGDTLERWQVIAYRPSVRQLYSDGLLIADAADRTPTYPSGPYRSATTFGGEWAWLSLYDGATALSGTTFADWALAVTATLASRFGLPVRPS